ncbi:MAG: PP2C family protein-serine/threonine phosphatase [Holophagales bacterium]|nr:PP2C family protein-serine/threonine phosphatase [Holophagales bacterium]
MTSPNRRRTLDELILLPEEQAVRAFFDDLNEGALYRLLGMLTAGALGLVVFLMVEGETWLLASPVSSLLLIRGLFSLRERPFLRRHFQKVLVTYLALQLVLVRVLVLDPEDSYHVIDILLPLTLLLFRLPSGPLLLLLGLVWSFSAGRDLWLFTFFDSAIDPAMLLVTSAEAVVVYTLVRNLTQKRRFDFLTDWRREHQRHRERLRMREELDEARRIQLSMLPRSDPSTPWLDIAGISIPASEVGGDYYEYFQVRDGLQALVVADAAGHGVASGLLLAGVRSCLYLLKETPKGPAEILDSLDRVVRHTTGRREFVTMLYALFDRDARRLRVSAAAHPPMLHFRAGTADVSEVGVPALPLGSKLRGASQELEVPFETGDIFLAYTDGIAETINSRGEVYGNDRLSERLRRTNHDRGAKEIRDLLLGDVWSFKADGQQTDDITLLVVKIR